MVGYWMPWKYPRREHFCRLIRASNCHKVFSFRGEESPCSAPGLRWWLCPRPPLIRYRIALRVRHLAHNLLILPARLEPIVKTGSSSADSVIQGHYYSSIRHNAYDFLFDLYLRGWANNKLLKEQKHAILTTEWINWNIENYYKDYCSHCISR